MDWERIGACKWQFTQCLQVGLHVNPWCCSVHLLECYICDVHVLEYFLVLQCAFIGVLFLCHIV